MCSVEENSSLALNLQEKALKKISDLVADLHAKLLVRTSGSGVYRDLSDDEEYLLESLDDQNVLHSVLAGCLAIDSCVISLIEGEKPATRKTMQILALSNTALQHLEKELHPYQKHSISELMSILGENFSYLLNQLSAQKPDFEKQLQTLPNLNFNTKAIQIQNQNTVLREKLALAEKKELELEIQLMKITEKTDQHKNRQQVSKQWQTQKNAFIHQISQLEQQVRILSKYNDVDVYYLLEELQYEVEKLKEQKFHDQNIIADIQMRLDNHSTMKNSKCRNIESIQGLQCPQQARMMPSRTLDSFTRLPPQKSSRMKIPFRQTQSRKIPQQRYRPQPPTYPYHDTFVQKSPIKRSPSYTSTEFSSMARLQTPFL